MKHLEEQIGYCEGHSYAQLDFKYNHKLKIAIICNKKVGNSKAELCSCAAQIQALLTKFKMLLNMLNNGTNIKFIISVNKHNQFCKFFSREYNSPQC